VSTPATPPFTAVISPISVPYRRGSVTVARSISRQIGTTGPEQPWMILAMSSTTMLGASAPSTEPITTNTISADSTSRRPRMSLSRGRNTPKMAPEVKNAVCDSPTATSSVLSSFAMVGSTALIMLALS